MQIIKSPWDEQFQDLASACQSSLQIASPFVKNRAVLDVLNGKQKTTCIELITAFKIENLYRKATDLSALQKLIDTENQVYNFQSLHAKIYIFDKQKAIVTSANWTYGGLRKNFEYGILIQEPAIVSDIVADFERLKTDSRTGKIKPEHIAEANAIIEKAPARQYVPLTEIEIESDVESDVFSGGADAIINSLTGWKSDVFSLLKTLPNGQFTAAEVRAFIPELERLHPTNNTVDAKLRQQLQQLRDTGLIEFLGNGKYRKLWR